MRNFLSLAFCCIALLLAGTVNAQTKIYAGAWFDIRYPASFSVKPSQPSPSAEGYESVFFIAPDKSVEFYVFSPQWNGDPKDIALNEATEKMVSSKQQMQGDSTLITWFTIVANNKTYTRTYEKHLNEVLNVHWVIGIKYKSQAAFKKYRTAYLRFKQSLAQFAD
jgi:hypothetical protein